MDMLERSNRKFLKHILGVPDTTADPAVYVLTGTITVVGVIHKCVRSLFGSVCRLGEFDGEKTCRETVRERFEESQLVHCH